MSEAPTVSLFSRAGCHLCAEARLLLDALAPVLGFTIDEVDIDADGNLLAFYDTAVPVVVVAGKEIARAPLQAAELRRQLQLALAPG